MTPSFFLDVFRSRFRKEAQPHHPEGLRWYDERCPHGEPWNGVDRGVRDRAAPRAGAAGHRRHDRGGPNGLRADLAAGHPMKIVIFQALLTVFVFGVIYELWYRWRSRRR
jgi:hypothetical protein